MRNSAAVIAHQIPLRPKNIGRISSASVWITKVRRVEMIAEIFPLFSPVKHADPKILNPLNR